MSKSAVINTDVLQRFLEKVMQHDFLIYYFSYNRQSAEDETRECALRGAFHSVKPQGNPAQALELTNFCLLDFNVLRCYNLIIIFFLNLKHIFYVNIVKGMFA